ncbi:MAG: TonB-dependent receptor plug domain-containing protein, partial [Candidatus Eisenbacteria bacterium]|nr:TonB-dependent receptor plug domain-containing protein [Candidatus Latescibacterota bacterium]MBD3303252.1 TonB-dependent receptor plug domain-containing protein [Candidatus Eisenbacteria bacterium]
MRARRFARNLIVIPTLAVLGALAPDAAAQEPTGMTLVGEQDSLRVYQIDEIVVQRTRANRPASPVAFTNVTHEEIQEVSYGQDVPMVLAATPSTYAYSDAANGFGYTYLKIRGFDQNRLGMLVNGVPLNDPEAHQVYWVDHGDVLSGAQSIQVQRGVGTPLFGATSFGGGVNVITSPLAIDPGLHLELGYGDYTEKGLDLPVRTYRASFASGPIDDGSSALYARYSRLNSEGYREASAADQESFGLSGLHAGGFGNHKIDLLVGRERTQFAWDGISPQYGFDLDDLDERRHNPYAVYENNVDDFTQVVGSITSEIPIRSDLAITNTAYYVDGDGFFEQFKEDRDFYDYGFESILMPDSTIVEETDLVQRRWLRNHYWGLLPQIEIPLAGGTGTFGAGLRRYEAAHYGEIVWTDVDVLAGPLDRYYSYDTEKTSFEGYGQIQVPVLERTILTAALQYQGHRYDYRQARIGNFKGYEFEVDHDFVNPRLGIKHNLSPRIDFYGSVGYAQREPSDSDYLDGDDPGAVPAFA